MASSNLKEEMLEKVLSDLNCAVEQNNIDSICSSLTQLRCIDCLDDLCGYWVDDPDDPYRRLVEKTIVSGRTDALRALLDATPSTPPSMCVELLSFAARHRQMGALKLILDRGHKDADRTVELALALGVAASSGHTEGIRLLLEHGADPLRPVDRYYRSSAQLGVLSLVILTNRNPDVQCVCILMDACLEKCETEKERLSFLHDLLCHAITAGNARLVEYFISRGAPLESSSGGNRKPLLVQAACERSCDMCRLLLDHGADVDVAHPSVRFQTPLMFAAATQVYDLVRLLVGKSRHINAATAAGESALSMSLDTIQNGTAMSTMLLLRCNASLASLQHPSPMHTHGLLRFILQCGGGKLYAGGFRALFASGMTRTFFENVIDLTAQTALASNIERAEYEMGRSWLRGTKSLRDLARRRVRMCLAKAEPRYSLLADFAKLELPSELVRFLFLEDVEIRGIDPRNEIAELCSL